MNKIKLYREEINLNQYELPAATRGIVPRWKIQLAEAGHVDLTPEEREAICYVFRKTLEEVFVDTRGGSNPSPRRNRKSLRQDPNQQEFNFRKSK